VGSHDLGQRSWPVRRGEGLGRPGYSRGLGDWLRERCGVVLEIVARLARPGGLRAVAAGWIVERCCAWLSRARPLARDYERLPRVAVGPHFAAFRSLLITRAVATFAQVGNSL
jgi:hypothetical protein